MDDPVSRLLPVLALSVLGPALVAALIWLALKLGRDPARRISLHVVGFGGLVVAAALPFVWVWLFGRGR